MASNKKEKYSIGNSRSPMMFRKKKNKKENLSRSLDDLISSVDHDDSDVGGAQWPEIASVKKMSPVVMCILPPCSADFVCSSLLSLGATPILTEGMCENVACTPISIACATRTEESYIELKRVKKKYVERGRGVQPYVRSTNTIRCFVAKLCGRCY